MRLHHRCSTIGLGSPGKQTFPVLSRSFFPKPAENFSSPLIRAKGAKQILKHRPCHGVFRRLPRGGSGSRAREEGRNLVPISDFRSPASGLLDSGSDRKAAV